MSVGSADCSRSSGAFPSCSFFDPMTDMKRESPSMSRPAAPGWGWETISAEVAEVFASIKLAMFLFIMLAVTATIGTVIQQGERPEVYIQEYDSTIQKLEQTIGGLLKIKSWREIYKIIK